MAAIRFVDLIRAVEKRGAQAAPFPESIVPMLAHAGEYPAREREYAFELKWDGYRAVAYLDRGKLRLQSRNLIDLTVQFPEVGPIAKAYGEHRIVFDGELVAPDENGRPSFQRLQNRMGFSGIKERAEANPVVYIVFDVLHVDGRNTMPLPYEERREVLEALEVHGDHWRLSPSSVGEGKHLLEMPGFEGVVAKRLGSAYEPGARSRAWIKIKRVKRQELVIGGWSEGQGSRKGRIGSLLVGYYEDSDRLHYAGSVGTGFTDATLDSLRRLLIPHVRATSPFDGPVDKKDVTFVEPRYIGEFEFTEWTHDDRLRHPSFKGLRDDKDPRDVIREER